MNKFEKILGDKLDGLEIGETMDTEDIMFVGISPETVKARVTKMEENRFWVFDLLYFGVYLGEACAEKREDGIFWSDL